MKRSVKEWEKILNGKFPIDAAKQILGDLTHYRHDGAYENGDIETLTNALIACCGNIIRVLNK